MFFCTKSVWPPVAAGLENFGNKNLKAQPFPVLKLLDFFLGMSKDKSQKSHFLFLFL